jgi:thiamine-monophosphate kinase
MQLSEIGEFGIIKKLRRRCAPRSRDVVAGIGDDAAVVGAGRKKMLITSDMMNEGIHFDLSYTTFYQLGYKFLAVNVSDVFAMGGEPEYFIVNLGLPETIVSENIDELYSGIIQCAGKYGVAVVGGDTCASRSGLVLSGTLTGKGGEVIQRSGARVGDGIFVNRPLGDSALGLRLLRKRRRKVRRFHPANAGMKLMKRHLMPEPAPLENTARVTAMIDVSDGLLRDLSHVCDESSVGAVLYKDKIPLSRETIGTAKKLNVDPFDFALTGGEDYALLFTAPAGLKTAAFRIGEITKRGRFLVDENGKKTALRAEGYEHFKKTGIRGRGLAKKELRAYG